MNNKPTEQLIENDRRLVNRAIMGATAIFCTGAAVFSVNTPNFESSDTCSTQGATIEYDIEDEDIRACSDGHEQASIPQAGLTGVVMAAYGATMAGVAVKLKRESVVLDNREADHTTED
jgi:hypothetical protein